MFYKCCSILFLCFLFSPLEAHTCCLFDTTFRVSCRYATDRTFHEIYDKASPNIGAELALDVWKGLGPFIGVDLSTVTGKTIYGKELTRYTEVPCSLGLRFIHTFSPGWQSYFAGGVVMNTVMVDNLSNYLQSDTDTFFGGIGRLGFRITLGDFFFLDLFGDYTWERKHYPDYENPDTTGRDVDLSALKAGGGLTFWF